MIFVRARKEHEPQASAQEPSRRIAPPARLGGLVRVWLLNVAIATVAVVVHVHRTSVTPALGGSNHHVPWYILALLFFICEVNVVHLQFRREAHSISLSEIPLVIGLFFTSPSGLLFAQLVGAGAALTLHRRQSPVKLAFNLSHFCLGTGIAVVVFRSVLGSSAPLGPSGWLATAAATFGASILGVLLVITAISLSEGRLQIEQLAQTLGLGLMGTLGNTSIGLIAVVLLWRDPAFAFLLLVPSAAMFAAYRAYTWERSKHESLEFLYESARIFHRSPAADAAVLSLLRHARMLFRADVAELILYPGGSEAQTLRSTVGPGDEVQVMVAAAGSYPAELPISRERPSMLFDRSKKAPVPRWLKDRNLEDAMITLLLGEEHIVGTILVGGRLGAVSGFDAEDLRLLETLASHAAVALENGRLEQSLAEVTELKEQLKHLAFHDPLTGLANRSLFTSRVEHALERRANGSSMISVLFIDLDDFKTINDGLGHAAGDRLLQAVAERIRACVRPEDTASRLGGDEFAVLLEHAPSEREPSVIADRIVGALRSSFLILSHEVLVHASIGIASAKPGTVAADELLRNADVAMYAAKMQGKSCVRTFQQEMQHAVLERHALKADLARAVSQRELSLLYQPILDLSTDALVAVEALARWNHPEKGVILPRAFIALAEESGLIAEIGRQLLREACEFAHSMHVAHPEVPKISITVNLSPRQLQDERLTAHVAEILYETQLEPPYLVFEITEGLTLENPEISIATLWSLKNIGVRLALDDFGTGYSSLSHLRQMPIDIIKIAKDFVDHVGEGPEDDAFVKAIVRLGETLHMTIVAEGIERRAQATRLNELNCELGQGNLLGEPMHGRLIEAMLMEKRTVAKSRHLRSVEGLIEASGGSSS